MELKLYNTLTRKKEPFRPLDPANVRMYVCGPTVYDFAHIGNARPVIVFDVLYRLLRHLAKQGVWDGGKGQTKVAYVRNITDVDDKINAKAAEKYPGLLLNDAIREVTKLTERQFHDDVAALGCLEPTHEPRATEYVRRTDGVLDMVTLIQRLIDNGNAYEKERHVLFRVGSMPDYGKLAGRSLDEMIAGARVEVAPFKENPMDFVLWKPSSENEPGWDSPWGRGRPGWHIECSTMSAALLGEEFDIHGGGIDLVFPHHENELAQSRCAFHSDRMAQVWMHNGFLQVEGAKMSKSLGNFVTIRELLSGDKFGGRPWHGGVLRLAMLKTDYRQPLDFSVEQLNVAWHEMEKFNFAVSRFSTMSLMKSLEWQKKPIPEDRGFLDALLNDLNTPLAISRLHKLCDSVSDTETALKATWAIKFLGLMNEENYEAYSRIGPVTDVSLAGRLRHLDIHDVSDRLRVALANNDVQTTDRLIESIKDRGGIVKIGPGLSISLIDGNIETAAADRKKVESLIELRDAARKAKDFNESDRIRDELKAMGVVLKDNKDGTTTWEVAR